MYTALPVDLAENCYEFTSDFIAEKLRALLSRKIECPRIPFEGLYRVPFLILTENDLILILPRRGISIPVSVGVSTFEIKASSSGMSKQTFTTSCFFPFIRTGLMSVVSLSPKIIAIVFYDSPFGYLPVCLSAFADCKSSYRC